MSLREASVPVLVGLGIVSLGVVAVGGYGIAVHSTQRTVTATVTKTWTQYSKDGTIYLIGTNKGVFEDDDSLMYFKFNSSDYFNNMKVGQTYTFDVTGWRIPFASVWPNIVSCEDCSSPSSLGAVDSLAQLW